MSNKKKNGFSYDLSFVGLLIFVLINVWLSLLIKKFKNEASERDLVIRREKAEVFRLGYNVNAFKRVFCMNIDSHEKNLAEPIKHVLTGIDEGGMQLLYLKADACSECNMHIVNWLVKRNAGSEGFRIVAHSSNEFSLEDLYNQGVIHDPSIIIWYDDALFDDRLSDSTADLVLVNKHHVIQALFPLDIIKDVRLFDEYLQCADRAFFN